MKNNYIGKPVQNKYTLKKYDLVYFKDAKTLCCVAGINETELIVETVDSFTDIPIEKVGVVVSDRYKFKNYESVLHDKFWMFMGESINELILIHRFKGKKPTIEQIKEVFNKYSLRQNV